MTPKHCFLGFLLSFFLIGVVEAQPAHVCLKPQRVHFQSRNFHNILHWQPGRACAGNSSVYFVQYKIEVQKRPGWDRSVLSPLKAGWSHKMHDDVQCVGDIYHPLKTQHPGLTGSAFGITTEPGTWYGQTQWRKKEDCWGIQEFFCDLTNETSEVQEAYYGRVRTASAEIHSGWTTTQRFVPWWETKIDPPVMNVTRVHGSLLVILGAPNTPYRNQKGKNVSMENYYELVYRVFVINNLLEKEQKVYEGAQRVVKIEALTPHTGYCVVAEIYQPLLDRSSQKSEERCVEMP